MRKHVEQVFVSQQFEIPILGILCLELDSIFKNWACFLDIQFFSYLYILSIAFYIKKKNSPFCRLSL